MSTNRRSFNAINLSGLAVMSNGSGQWRDRIGRQPMVTALGFAVLVAGLACSGSGFAQATVEKAGYEAPAQDKWPAEKPAAEKWGSDKQASDKSGSEKSAADRLTQIEAETLVLKAREKQIDTQAAILTKQNEIAMKRALNDQLTNKAASGDPVVRSIEGIGRSIYATLQLNNGSMIEARTGDVLPNGMKVVSVRPNEVIVQSKNKRRIRLPAAMGGDSYSSYTGPGMNLPLQRGAVR